jgi:hypothetical protein
MPALILPPTALRPQVAINSLATHGILSESPPPCSQTGDWRTETSLLLGGKLPLPGFQRDATSQATTLAAGERQLRWKCSLGSWRSLRGCSVVAAVVVVLTVTEATEHLSHAGPLWTGQPPEAMVNSWRLGGLLEQAFSRSLLY